MGAAPSYWFKLAYSRSNSYNVAFKTPIAWLKKKTERDRISQNHKSVPYACH